MCAKIEKIQAHSRCWCDGYLSLGSGPRISYSETSVFPRQGSVPRLRYAVSVVRENKIRCRFLDETLDGLPRITVFVQGTVASCVACHDRLAPDRA